MGRFRRRSIRLRNHDYSEPAAYFLTIGTWDGRCLLGEIVHGEMRLNPWGEMVRDEWLRTGILRADVRLDTFVIMPNHFHAILFIRDECRGTARRAPTFENFGKPVSGSLPTVVRAFKSAVTKRIHELQKDKDVPVWQRNYHERVIRNEAELFRFRQYIQENPLNWHLDLENPNRIVESSMRMEESK